MASSPGQAIDEGNDTANVDQAANATTQQQQPQAHFRFLDLPPELRNRIYGLVLIENERIRITNKVPQPPFSSTKQIREETLRLWYLSNAFIIKVLDCDVSSALAFERHRATMGLRCTNELGLRIRGLNWQNLMEWCYYVWEGELNTLISKDGQDPGQVATVICAAHKIAKLSQVESISWESCQLQLEALRIVAGRVDSKWLE